MARTFDSGASRDDESGKLDYEGFLSPQVLQAFAEYMHEMRALADGSVRSSDNWQRGMPLDVYMKSLLRHVFDLWLLHRGYEAVRPESGESVDVHHALGAILFNAQGYWLETLKSGAEPEDVPEPQGGLPDQCMALSPQGSQCVHLAGHGQRHYSAWDGVWWG